MAQINISHKLIQMGKDGRVKVSRLIAICRNGIVLTEGIDFRKEGDWVILTKQSMDPFDTWSAFILS